MSLSNLYFRGCFEQPSDEQKSAVEELNVESGVVDRSCLRDNINTCGMSIEQLFDTYPFYNPQKGLYKSWGDIEFPWQINNLTPNLLLNSTEDKWGVASYMGVVAYHEGDRVLVVEDDGYRIGVYEANTDIVSISKHFDSSKWVKVCHVETTEPAGLPTVKELRSRYKPYKLELYDKEWGEYHASWSSELFEQSVAQCSTIAELESCLKSNSSDEWSQVRIKRQFFYKHGDIVLVEGECGDVLCLYIATQNIPATEAALETQARLNLKDPAWQRIYCVPTGRNKCLEYQRKKEPELGYDVVEIGSLGHFVEVPVPYRLRPNSQSLRERAEVQPPPKVLTQAEIDALPQPQEE